VAGIASHAVRKKLLTRRTPSPSGFTKVLRHSMKSTAAQSLNLRI